MPNRILRDCTDSEKINLLDVYEERFFYRLIMVVDDYGRFYAHAGLLKAKMFPFLLDKIREADISRWLVNCQAAGLITLYEIAGKHYLQIEEFKQRLDKAKEKYPPPIVGSSITTDNDFPPETNQNPKQKPETETETKSARVSFSVGLDFFKKEIQNSTQQLDAAVRRHLKTKTLDETIAGREKILAMVPDFVDTCTLKGKTNDTYKENCNYFSNWLCTEFSKQKTNGQTTFKKNGASHSDAELADALNRHLNQQRASE